MSSIRGYRPLTEDEIETVNKIKEWEISIGQLWYRIRNTDDVDPRWVNVAKTHFQEGFSALVRSVTQPDDVYSEPK